MKPNIIPIHYDPLVIVVSRAEVESHDTSVAMSVLNQLCTSPQVARGHLERVDIAFHGYDHQADELFEIPAVRQYVQELDNQFPYWLYFLSKRHLGLQCLLHCFLPPFLKEEARNRIFPERINQLLTQRWYPAMAQMCQLTGLSDEQVELLVDRALQYITEGRFPLDAKPFE
jgi:hypothetical protein